MNKKFASRFEENKAYFDHQRNMRHIRKQIASVALIIATVLVWLNLVAMITFAIWDACTPYDEYETHSAGAQITHCEMVATRRRGSQSEVHRFIFVTGDDFSAEIEVDEKTYAQYKEGDWVEVEIAEMERYLFGYRDTTTKYRILGDMIED